MHTNQITNFKIWVDADACPKVIKEVIFNVSFKNQIPVILVANSYLSFPKPSHITLIQVEKGDDVADQYIATNSDTQDLVITADIPLAAMIIEKGGTAINPRGEIYDEENIQERLTMRNFLKDLRDAGEIKGGPSAFDTKSKAQFANSLNMIVTKKLKTSMIHR